MNVEDAIRIAMPHSLTPEVRLQAMAEAVLRIDREGVPGDIVECGVWRGGNIILARLLSPLRRCWLYDTFTGMTEPTDLDRRRSGDPASDDWRVRQATGTPWCAASLSEVRECMRETGTLNDSLCRFVEGDVVETLSDPLNLPNEIAVLRLDTDWHTSTHAELVHLYPRLAPGGSLIVDDYGHWAGARKAVDEYFDKGMPAAKMIDYSAIAMVKPC